MRSAIIGAIACLVLTPALTPAKTIATFVGCTYKSRPNNLPAIDWSDDDVKLIKDVVRHDETVSNTLLAEQGQGQAISRKRILSAVEAAASRCGPEDTYVFFFSGHGVNGFSRPGSDEQLHGPLLVTETVGSDNATRYDPEYLPVAAIQRSLLRCCCAKTKILVLDACASGGELSVADRKSFGRAWLRRTRGLRVR